MVGTGRVLASLVALALGATCGESAAAALTAKSFIAMAGAGAERGVARIVCELRSADRTVRVRAAVLDLGEAAAGHDVLLAPAHGLPRERARINDDCRVTGTLDSPVGIVEFWLPEARHGGLRDDWVVLMTRTRLAAEVGRLRAGVASGRLLEQLHREAWPVALMAATPAADRRDCRILDVLGERVFSHSCSGWAGLSGAPILVGVDGEPVMIALHVAHVLPPVEAAGSPFRGIGLAIDEEIAAAIEEATMRAQAAAARPDTSAAR